MTQSVSSESRSCDDLARSVLQIACDRKGKIAVVESCTGGSLASALTSVKGLSHAFDRGFVTYSETAKSEMLGIDPDIIDRAGAVSEEVGTLMAQRALTLSGAMATVAVTGFIGGELPEAENGLVHIVAVSRIGHVRHRECHFGDVSRDQGCSMATTAALELLLEAVRKV